MISKDDASPLPSQEPPLIELREGARRGPNREPLLLSAPTPRNRSMGARYRTERREGARVGQHAPHRAGARHLQV